MTCEEKIKQIRVLHAPTVDLYPECRGCDLDGYEAEAPAWPCRTAQLVYTTDEIEAVAEGARAALAQFREKLNDAPLPRSATMLQQVYAPFIEQALRAQPIFRNLP